MKKILLTVFSLTILLSANAQSVEVGHAEKGFGGVYGVMSTNSIYTYHTADNKADKNKSDLVIYNFTPHLEPRDTVKIPFNKSGKVVSVCLNMNSILVLVADVSKNTLTTIGYEVGNGIIKNTTQSVNSDFFGPRFKAEVFPGMPDGFAILTGITGKKRGYKIEYINREFETKWTKTYIPEKGDWDITDAFPLMEKLVLLRKESSGDKFVFSLIGIVVEPGEVIFENELKENENYLYPDCASVSREFFNISGNYYKNGKTSEKSDGLFFQLYNMGGTPEVSMFAPISEIAAEIDPKIANNLLDGSSKIFAQSFDRKRMGFVGIGEVYTLTTGPNDKTLRTGDFIMLSRAENVDPEHIDSNIQINVFAKRGNSVVLTNTGNLTDQELAKYAHDKDYFDFRDYRTIGPEGRVLYLTSDSIQNYVRAYTILDSTIADKGQMSVLDFSDSSAQKQKPTNTFKLNLAQPLEYGERANKGALPAINSERGVIFYDIKSPRLIIRREEFM